MRPTKNQGFTLIEICVAIAIVAMGILTAMSILTTSIRWAADAKKEITVVDATISAIEALESMTTIGTTASSEILRYSSDTDTVLDSTPVAYVFFQCGPYEVHIAVSNTTTAPSKYHPNAKLAVYPRNWNPIANDYSGIGNVIFMTTANINRP